MVIATIKLSSFDGLCSCDEYYGHQTTTKTLNLSVRVRRWMTRDPMEVRSVWLRVVWHKMMVNQPWFILNQSLPVGWLWYNRYWLLLLSSTGNDHLLQQKMKEFMARRNRSQGIPRRDETAWPYSIWSDESDLLHPVERMALKGAPCCPDHELMRS